MGLKVGDLFVNLAIKGSEVSVRALASVRSGLDEAQGSSLALKAAILAVLYGVERFTGVAGQRGMELQKFADYTGLSAQKLQQWQYAMRMSGVEANEVQNSIQGLQSALTKMGLNQGAPGGMDQVSKVLGAHGEFLDKAKWKDAFYMLDKLRSYSKFEKNPALANEMLSTFGLSPSMIQALRSGKIDPNKVSASKILNPGDVGALSKVNTAWQDFHNTLELFGEKFIAKHGLKAIGDISKITGAVMKLSESLIKLAEDMKVFQLIGKAFEGWDNILSWVNQGVHGMTKEGQKELIDQKFSPQQQKESKERWKKMHDFMWQPYVNPVTGSGKENKVNQENNIHIHTDTKDPKDHGQKVKKEIQGAYYQMQSLTMVT